MVELLKKRQPKTKRRRKRQSKPRSKRQSVFDMSRDNVIARYYPTRDTPSELAWELRYWPERNTGEWKTITFHRPYRGPKKSRARNFGTGWNGERISDRGDMYALEKQDKKAFDWLNETLPKFLSMTWKKIEEKLESDNSGKHHSSVDS